MIIEIPKRYTEEGLVSARNHPKHDAIIYNYTPKVQFEGLWDDVTLMCRGLILDSSGNVLARPIKKFFNIEESYATLPDEPFVIYDKLDGSFIIIALAYDDVLVASRGSFESDQAKKAGYLLNEKYRDSISRLHSGTTYMFEIIYPDNKIVVNYGDDERLVGLAIAENTTGRSSPFPDELGFPVVRSYALNEFAGVKYIQDLSGLNLENKEGFVVHFPESDLRVKMKFEDYKRLHRIMTNMSAVSIWETLRDGQELPDLSNVPDEFYTWVKQVILKLKNEYRSIEQKAKADFGLIKKRPCLFKDRKETAEYINRCKYPSIMFCMLDGYDYTDIIWKRIRPRGDVPFLDEESKK